MCVCVKVLSAENLPALEHLDLACCPAFKRNSAGLHECFADDVRLVPMAVRSLRLDTDLESGSVAADGPVAPLSMIGLSLQT